MTLIEAYKRREREAIERVHLHIMVLGLTPSTVVDVLTAEFHRDRPLTEQPRLVITPLPTWPRD